MIVNLKNTAQSSLLMSLAKPFINGHSAESALSKISDFIRFFAVKASLIRAAIAASNGAQILWFIKSYILDF